jgi:hypothetical protein
VVNLLVPGDSRTDTAVPECALPAVVRISQGGALADVAIPDDLVRQLNDVRKIKAAPVLTTAPPTTLPAAPPTTTPAVTAKAGFATAKDAADAAGCEGFTDLGPETKQANSIGGDYPLAIDQGTCTLDGISLKLSVYASQGDRQTAETVGSLLASAFLAHDARLVLGSGANVIVGENAKNVQTTSPDAEKVVRKVADETHLSVIEIKGKSS